jgi:hypothetical protein
MASSRTSTRVTAGKTAGRPSRKSIRTAAVAVILVMVLAAVILSSVFLFHQGTGASGRIGLAVEFMNHAAAAYISQDKGWFEAEGLDLSAYTSYVTGMALASALGRGDIQVAYMCLVPAINAYANAGVPIKIVAGTHKYGYALVADPRTVAGVGKMNVVRQENICLSRFRTPVSDSSKRTRIFPMRIESSEFNLMIRSHSGGRIHDTSFYHAIIGIGFEPGNEGYLVVM